MKNQLCSVFDLNNGCVLIQLNSTELSEQLRTQVINNSMSATI